MRVLKRICAGLLLCWIAAQAALAQEDDKGFLTRTLQDALSGAGRVVSIDGFQGALSSTASFDQMTIADDDGIWLTLRGVTLDWNRSALLRGRLEVTQLTAESLDILRAPQTDETTLPEAEAPSFSLPDLPVSITIAEFGVDRIALGAPLLGEAAELRVTASAELTDTLGDVDLLAERIDAKQGRFAIKANLGRAEGVLDLLLSLTEGEGGMAARLLNIPGQPSVDLRVEGQGPLSDFTSDIRLSTDGRERIAGQVTLGSVGSEATTPDRRLQADIGGDITTVLAPRYRAFFGTDVRLRLDALRQADGAVDVKTFSLQAQALDLEGALRLDAESWPTFVDVTGRIAAADGTPVLLPVSHDPVTVEQVDLAVSYDASAGDALESVIRARALKTSAASVAEAEISLDGTLQNARGRVGSFLGDLIVATTGVEQRDPALASALGQSVRGAARLTYVQGQPFQIDDLTVSGQDYALSGAAEVEGVETGLSTTLDVIAEADDLRRFAALAGQALSGTAEVTIAGRIAPLSGQFGLELSGQTRALGIGIPQADALLAGQTRLRLGARRDEGGTVLRDLTLNNAAINLTANATLRSAESQIRAQAALSNIGLVLPQYEGPVRVQLKADQTAAGWRGDVETAGPYDAAIKAAGQLTPQLDVTYDVTVPKVKPFVPSIEGPLMMTGRAAQRADQHVFVEADIAGPYAITAAAQGVATGPDAALQFDFSLPNINVFVPQIAGPLTATGTVERDGAAWQIYSGAKGPAGTQVRLEGQVQEDMTLDLQLAGSAPLGLTRPFLAPRNLQGQARFDLAVKGPPALSSVSGTVQTTGASLSAPNLRVALNDIDADIRLNGERAQVNAQAAAANGGRLQVTGGLGLSGALPTDLQVTLAQLVLIDPQLYRTVVNGALRVAGPLGGGVQISGQIDLAETEVSIPATGITSIGDIPAIRHVGSPAAATRTRARAGIGRSSGRTEGGARTGAGYGLNLSVAAPGRIFVRGRGRGLDAELGGGLLLTGTTNRVISSGRFDLLRGRLDILGKRFDLVEGAIQFQGDLVPYIRFVSATTTQTGEVRVIVDGPADAPEVTFAATPDAPQDEVLAQLLFGRSLSDISAFQALQLASAVATLAGRGGGGIIANLREGFGLDDLDVTTTEDGATAVRAGKYIAENVYTDVTAASDGTGEVSLNLDLTPNLTGKATLESDGNTGIGIFFEKDY